MSVVHITGNKEAEVSGVRKNLIFIGILSGAVTSSLTLTIIATVLPEIAVALNGQNLYSWVFSSFLLVSTLFIPLFSKLSDIYGYKKFYITGMTIFLIGTLLCSISQSMTMLIIARMIQGIGAGAVIPITTALVSILYPEEKRGKVMGIYALVQLLSNIAGPLIGGYIARLLGWQWTFLVIIPIGILSVVLIGLFKESSVAGREKRSGIPLDILGAALLGGAIGLLVQGFTGLGRKSSDIFSLIYIIFSLALFVLFYYQEKRHKDPIISLKILAIRNVLLSNISVFIVGLLMYGVIVIFPVYTQKLQEQGYTPFMNLLIPIMIGFGFGAIIFGALIKRRRYKAFSTVGWIAISVSLLGLIAVSITKSYSLWSYPLNFVLGFGIGGLMPVSFIPAQNAVSNAEQAVVGGIIQLSRNIGGALGIPVLTSLLGNHSRWSSLFQNRYCLVFVFLFTCAVFGLVIGLQYRGSANESP